MTNELFLLFTRTGAEWVMYALIALSVASVAIIVDRAVFFARFAGSRAGELAPLLAGGRLDAARVQLMGRNGLEAAVVRAALDAAEDGPASVEEIVASTIRRERPAYERGLGFLGTLGSNAPFLGLFGTVVGIIKAFSDLGVASAKTAGAAAVMSGLSEALVATAVGIFVAIPAVVAHNAYNRRLRGVVNAAESIANALAAHLQKDEVRSETIVRATNRRLARKALETADDGA